MRSIDIKKYLTYFLLMASTGIIVLAGQAIGLKKEFIGAVPGMLLIILLALLAYSIKDIFPKFPLPAYASATIIGMIVSLEALPISKFFAPQIGVVEFMPICTPLLAFAGISVGNKIEQLKAMSWKIVIISLVVFTSIFFACALIAQTVLTLQGRI
ncbi:hypothetical protein [uncultured Cetobacterium sp.]|uniref:hypothetical protein n=1 Tax=uncultured Cetobacterium sp. TaxID=527638 RepID=UPI0026222E8D|nr:hypothetical protein [uncultured Cetobacterium sp.]